MATEEKNSAQVEVNPRWPDEIAAERAAFYGIRTAALFANEPRWIHRRVERLELIDEQRADWHMSVDFTLPDLTLAPWDAAPRQWFIPVGLLQRRLLRALDVRDEYGGALPVLTREQNASIAWAMLSFLASGTLEDVTGSAAGLRPEILVELADVAGARRDNDDHPSADDREDRAADAIQLFRQAAIRAARGPVHDELEDQRQLLWRDETMRGFMSTLAERFLLLVVLVGEPGDRRIVKVRYEQELEAPPLFPVDVRKAFALNADWRDIWGQLRSKAVQAVLVERVKQSVGFSAFPVKAGTRAVLGPESYHVEIAAPQELVIEYASLERTQTITDLATGNVLTDTLCVAEDFCTERAHLYESLFTGGAAESIPPGANEEVTTGSTIKADLFIRPSFVRQSLIIGAITTGMVLSGLILKAAGVARSGDVTALIVVLPALFAAYLIPGEHRLVRKMFLGLRSLVLLLSIVSFGAAASLTLKLHSETMVVIWIVLFLLAAGATTVIWGAYRTSKHKMTKRPAPGVHSA